MTRRKRAKLAAKGSWNQLHDAGKEFKQAVLDNFIAPLLMLVVKLIHIATRFVVYLDKRFNKKG